MRISWKKIPLSIFLCFLGSMMTFGQTSIKFKKVHISSEKAESCTFGDFDGDGIQDIASGRYWFKGPEFKERYLFRTLRHYDPKDTTSMLSPDDFTLSRDVDGDGYDDIVAGGHDYGLFWYKNPGKNVHALWQRILIDASRPEHGNMDTVSHEHNLGYHNAVWVDIDNDGKAEELISSGTRVAGIPTDMCWFKFEHGKWNKYDTGQRSYQWGAGVGDINADGRNDIVCADAWFEAPVDPHSKNWVRHPYHMNVSVVEGDPEGRKINENGVTAGHVSNIYIYDVNGDGLNDFIASSGHAAGIFWYEQKKGANGDITFTEHLIDNSWKQSHNLAFYDINNDGYPDLVAGRRWNGWGPEDKAPNGLYWYEYLPNKPEHWLRHVISFNEQIGFGNGGAVKDIDGDGDLDIVGTTRENGCYLLINHLDPPAGYAKAQYFKLFNGKNLEGWSVQGMGKWSIDSLLDDGVLIGTKAKEEHSWGHLVTNRIFGDSFIRMKYKVSQSNSGVYVRSTIGGDYGVSGLQIDLGGKEDGLPMGVTNSFYKWLDLPQKSKKSGIYGAWNDIEIETSGHHLRTWVNGELRIDAEVDQDMMPDSGRIALQLHAGDDANEVCFKDVEAFVPRRRELGPENKVLNPSFEEGGSPWTVAVWHGKGALPERHHRRVLKVVPEDGDFYAEVASDRGYRLYQDLITVPGKSYSFSFYAQARPGVDQEESRFDVFIGSKKVKRLLPDFGKWTKYTYSFVAKGKSTRITFADLNYGATGIGALIDLVSVFQQ